MVLGDAEKNWTLQLLPMGLCVLDHFLRASRTQISHRQAEIALPGDGLLPQSNAKRVIV